MNILELYSGIGGMHLAFKESGCDGQIKAAIDINNIANEVYTYNFPSTKLLNKNIKGLSSIQINNIGVDTILMSPPCQPFTRNGLQEDINDPRTDSFCHILDLLKDTNVRRILIENVKGFEKSKARDLLIETITSLGFTFQEFLLTPSQIGIPNTRLRYYCIAKKLPEVFSFEKGPLMTCFPHEVDKCDFSIGDVLDNDTDKTDYLLSEDLLRKRVFLLDICYPKSTRSCCFTKAYGRYTEGTGSVFTEKSEDEVVSIFKQLKDIDKSGEEYLHLAKSLKLRFFTPREICRLMSFPENYSFPSCITDRQKYMVLGNSINVKIVSELIKLIE